MGAYSLALPAGATAQSPYTCVNASYPTFRLFARSGVVLSTVAVAVVYKTLLGTVALPLGLLVPGGNWQPTQPLLTGSVVAGLLSGGTAQAALRFTALTGSSEIDDVYIDPRIALEPSERCWIHAPKRAGAQPAGQTPGGRRPGGRAPLPTSDPLSCKCPRATS